MSEENDQSLQGVLNYTGSSILTINCILSGLASQLAAVGGNDAVKAASDYALKVADAIPTAPGVAPDKEAISKFFRAHTK